MKDFLKSLLESLGISSFHALFIIILAVVIEEIRKGIIIGAISKLWSIIMPHKDLLIQSLGLKYYIREFETREVEGQKEVLYGVLQHSTGYMQEWESFNELHKPEHNQFIFVNLSIQNVSNLENQIIDITAKIVKPVTIDLEVESIRPSMGSNVLFNALHPFMTHRNPIDDYFIKPLDLVPSKNYTKYIALRIINPTSKLESGRLNLELIDKNNKHHRLKIDFIKTDGEMELAKKSRWTNFVHFLI